jgi:hypothetical protein
VDHSKLTLGDKIASIGAIAFILFAIILDWHRVCFGGFCTGLSVFSGDGEAIPLIGFLVFLCAIAIAAGILLPKAFGVDLPELPVPLSDAIFYVTAAATVLILLKLLLKFEYIGFGAWLMIIACGAMAYGGFLIKQEGGSESPTTDGGTGTAPF